MYLYTFKIPFGIISPKINATSTPRYGKNKCENRTESVFECLCFGSVSYQFTLSNAIWIQFHMFCVLQVVLFSLQNKMWKACQEKHAYALRCLMNTTDFPQICLFACEQMLSHNNTELSFEIIWKRDIARCFVFSWKTVQIDI